MTTAETADVTAAVLASMMMLASMRLPFLAHQGAHA